MTSLEASRLFEELRGRRPLVHHITNYVTVNDCANIAICAGAAPVMADAIEEMDDMVAIAGALVLNIGTLNYRLVDSMLAAGRRANGLGIPVIVDPVGAGATPYRTETVNRLLKELDVAVLKGNAGEIGIMAGSEAKVVGVDSHGVEGDPVEICREYAERLGITVVMTAPEDIISNGKDTYVVSNGHPMMELVSGTGCMASTVVGAFNAISEDRALACASALVTMGLAGERAALEAKGPMSFRTKLFDSMHNMTSADVESGAKVRKI